MRLHILLVSLILLVLVQSTSYSQSSELLTRITADDGLSQNLVFDSLQDHQGFIWFGTKDGLSRYDGHDFRIYKTDPSSRQSLAGNYVTLTYQDRDLNIWVETRPGGLHIYDPLMDHFTRLSDLTGPVEDFYSLPVWDLYGSNKTGWWAATGNGLYHISPEKDQITMVDFDPHGASDRRINNIIPSAEEEEIFFSTTDGIYKLNANSQYVEPVSWLNNHLLGKRLMMIYRTADHKWVIAENSTLQFISEEGEFLFKTDIHDQFSLNIREINDILEDDRKNLWIVLDRRVFRLNMDSGTITEFEGISYAKNLLIDGSGVLWIGTAGMGAFKYDPKKNRFNLVPKSFTEYLLPGLREQVLDQTDIEVLTVDADIISIVQESEDTYWALSRRVGIYEYNRRSREMTRHTLALHPDGHKRYNIYWMDRHDDGHFYFIYSQGIATYKPGEGTEFIQEMGKLFPDWQGRMAAPVVEAFNVVKKHAGRYWVGAVEYGLSSYHPETGEVNTFRHISGDENSLSSNYVLSLSPDPVEPERYMWAGTDGGGLNRINIETGEILRFTEKDGLPNNVIYAIYPDRHGNLWMSSNKGIIRMNAETFGILNFVKSDGLQSNEFNRRQHTRFTDGRLLFCGVEGCNLFDPDRFELNITIPRVAITGVSVMNENILPFGSEWFSNQEGGPVLNVDWSQNIIGFEFASLDFSAPDKNQFRYRFPPFLDEWTEIGSRREIFFTNLDPGSYRLEVQGSNNDGIWSTEYAMLGVVVKPPFWMTAWFRVLAVALFSLLIVGTAVFFSRRKYQRELREMKYKMMVDQERLRISRDMHDDLGSRLTQIRIMSRFANSNDDLPSPVKQKIESISNEAEDVISKFSEIVWSLNPKNDTLESLAGFMVQYAESFCRKVQISCRIEADDVFPGVMIPSDVRHNLLSVFKESLNNAAKYAGCSEIRVQITLQDDELIISVRDNGCGFDQKTNGANGQGLRSMKARMEDISGEWTLDTKKGKGTAITMRCRVTSYPEN